MWLPLFNSIIVVGIKFNYESSQNKQFLSSQLSKTVSVRAQNILCLHYLTFDGTKTVIRVEIETYKQPAASYNKTSQFSPHERHILDSQQGR